MNYLISAYSVNPYKGSEVSIGRNWVLQYEKNYKEGDRITFCGKVTKISMYHKLYVKNASLINKLPKGIILLSIF